MDTNSAASVGSSATHNPSRSVFLDNTAGESTDFTMHYDQPAVYVHDDKNMHSPNNNSNNSNSPNNNNNAIAEDEMIAVAVKSVPHPSNELTTTHLSGHRHSISIVPPSSTSKEFESEELDAPDKLALQREEAKRRFKSLRKFFDAHIHKTFHNRHFKVRGMHNFLWLGLIIFLVLIQENKSVRGILHTWWVEEMATALHWTPEEAGAFVIAIIFGTSMSVVAYLSYHFANVKAELDNKFTFTPIIEVASLFFGIFATVVPALELLEHNANSIGFDTPRSYYWGSGALSSILDNAPTYYTFLAAAMGRYSLSVYDPDEVKLATEDSAIKAYVVAISIASVFFGGMTYIGNGPNLMVKSICEERGCECPTFMAYIYKYALTIALPIFTIVGFAFVS